MQEARQPRAGAGFDALAVKLQLPPAAIHVRTAPRALPPCARSRRRSSGVTSTRGGTAFGGYDGAPDPQATGCL